MSSVDRCKRKPVSDLSLLCSLQGIIDVTDTFTCLFGSRDLRGVRCEKPPLMRTGAVGSGGSLLRSGPYVDPAVDVECLAGDVVSVLDQEAHRACYLLWLAEASEGNGLQELLLRLLGYRGD